MIGELNESHSQFVGQSEMELNHVDEQISHSILTQLDSIDRGVKAIRDRLATLDEQRSEILAEIGRLAALGGMPEPQEFLTVKQAAAYLNVSKQTIYRMKHLHVKRGRSIRLRRSTLDRGFREDPRKASQMRSRKR